MSLAWVPVSPDENSNDSNADSSREESEHTHITVLEAWQDALDAFPAEMLRSFRTFKSQIQRFIVSRLG